MKIDQIFWPKKPYASWVKYNAEARWQSPIGDAPELTAEQTTGEANIYRYEWNESMQSWGLVTTPVTQLI
jgi:hypothetical protein